MRKYNELWRDLHNAATDDDFEKLRDTFRAGPGEVQLGLTVHDIDICPNMSGLRKILADKGIISEERNDFETLKTHMKECGLVKFAQIVDSHLQKHRNSEEGVSTDGDRSGITRTTGQKRKIKEEPTPKSVKAARLESNSDAIISDSPRNHDERYKRTRSKPGLVLIINQFTDDRMGKENKREGTLKDQTDIEEFFEKLNFVVKAKQDLSKTAALSEIEKMKKELADKVYDSFILFILSHGVKEGIQMVEEQTAKVKVDNSSTEPEILTIAEIADKLIGSELPEMSGKPKIIMVQACRGDEDMLGIVSADNMNKSFKYYKTNKEFVPNEADFLIAQSQKEDYRSYRYNEKGSLFIQAFMNVLKTNEHRHILDILTMVNSKVAKEILTYGMSNRYKQMPVFVSSLRNFFYFK